MTIRIGRFQQKITTKQIENGTFVFKRFLEEESRVCKEILGQSAFLLSGRSGETRHNSEGVVQERDGTVFQEKALIGKKDCSFDIIIHLFIFTHSSMSLFAPFNTFRCLLAPDAVSLKDWL